ncbi:MAG: hypothetical protein WCE65_04520 [Methanoregula sp.]
MHRSEKYLAILIIVLFAGTLLAGCVFAPQAVVVPHIDVSTDNSAPINVTNTFLFENSKITISLPVDAAVCQAAKSTSTSVTVYGNVTDKVWITDSYMEMINDPAQEQMYTDLITQFRKIKNDMGLSSDEYLELMATYIQSLPYQSRPGEVAKFPVETVVDGTGNCADKSLLLAGLLSREGYKVAIFTFTPENHMALGVGSPDTLYKDTGYAYLESTNLSYVGIPPAELEGGIELTSEPMVVPVGNGTTEYTSGAETAYLNNTATVSNQKAISLETQDNALVPDLTAKQGQISEIQSRMNAMLGRGNIPGYNSEVSSQNSLVASYNAELAQYNRQVALDKSYANVYNYIISHVYDRKGTYAWVKANMPE